MTRVFKERTRPADGRAWVTGRELGLTRFDEANVWAFLCNGKPLSCVVNVRYGDSSVSFDIIMEDGRRAQCGECGRSFGCVSRSVRVGGRTLTYEN